MMETELCSSRVFSPSSRVFSPFRDESGDEELSVLPRHTKVIVTGNNRTKSVLVGLQGVVKKAVGLGGWHWLVLKNGAEVKLQRNALSVIEPPTGNEVDDDYDLDDSGSGSDMGEKDNHRFPAAVEFNKLSKPRIRYARPWVPSASTKSMSRVQSNSHAHAPQLGIDLSKLGTSSLWRYCQRFKLATINPNPTKEQLVNIVQQHLSSQQLDETQVILEFIDAANRLQQNS